MIQLTTAGKEPIWVDPASIMLIAPYHGNPTLNLKTTITLKTGDVFNVLDEPEAVANATWVFTHYPMRAISK